MSDLCGQRFGKLEVVAKSPDPKKPNSWEVVCDCGEKTFARTHNLISGKMKDCHSKVHKVKRQCTSS